MKELLKAGKIIVTSVGAVSLPLLLIMIYDAVSLFDTSKVSSPVIILSCIAGLLSSSMLISSLFNSIRVRFRKSSSQQKSKEVYGFFTVLAVGIGSTVGSPLFVLIPLNVVQYEYVSFGSLLIATILSVLMAKVYSDMYAISKQRGLESVGGPSFTRIACGTRSIRYFIARLSMWISNTTLAAYSKLIFVLFDLELFPRILSSLGLSQMITELIVYSLAVVFIGWSVVNAALESRILRSVGVLQVVSTTLMVAILIYHSFYLGSAHLWNLSGITKYDGNSLLALIVNTGYLYLLFFGFQEIQALEKDSLSNSTINLLFKKIVVPKEKYFGYAMILTVIISSLINILYGLAVYSVHPSPALLESSSIPALYIASVYGNGFQELIVAVSFLIASITTFVPAFVAASRHLSSLCEDGYLPSSLSSLSWVFTLVAIFILALGNADFLVTITDFLVLISLGIISMSAVWIGGIGKKTYSLSLLVGLSCFVAAFSIYFVNSSVVIFGFLSALFTYMIFNVFELGLEGTELFLGSLTTVCFLSLLLFGSFSDTGQIATTLNLSFLSNIAFLPLLLLLLTAAQLADVFINKKIKQV